MKNIQKLMSLLAISAILMMVFTGCTKDKDDVFSKNFYKHAVKIDLWINEEETLITDEEQIKQFCALLSDVQVESQTASWDGTAETSYTEDALAIIVTKESSFEVAVTDKHICVDGAIYGVDENLVPEMKKFKK